MSRYTCCYKCDERHANCHSECLSYKIARENYEAERKARLKDHEYNEYRTDQRRHDGYAGFGSITAVRRRHEREDARKFEAKLRKENKRVTEKKLREP